MRVNPKLAQPWDVSPAEARDIQCRLHRHVRVSSLVEQPRIVAGVDVSVRQGLARSAVVHLSFPGLEPIEATAAERPATFPYVPGLLAFREGPVVLEALGKLEGQLDVMIFDAHGLAHPRRMGLATHMGILLDIPTVGCAKSRLCGDYTEPDARRGSWQQLLHGDEVIGAVLRTRQNVKPVFVSVGHRMCLDDAVALVLACAPTYRLPETTRWAHRVAGGAPLARPALSPVPELS